MRSVGLSGVLDLFDSLFYYWRNLVIPLFLDCVGCLVATYSLLCLPVPVMTVICDLCALIRSFYLSTK